MWLADLGARGGEWPGIKKDSYTARRRWSGAGRSWRETQPGMTGKGDNAVVSVENTYSYVYMYSYTMYSSSFIFN